MSRHSSVFLAVFSMFLCIQMRTCVRFGLPATNLHVREDNRAANLLEFSFDSVNASKISVPNKNFQSSNIKSQRVPENAHSVNVTTLGTLNDSNTILSIQYAGRGTAAIVAFVQFSSTSIPNSAIQSAVFVSYDAGRSFHKKTFNATRETFITSMYFSPVFNSHFLTVFTDAPHKTLFISTDFVHSTIEVPVSFQPDIISYHRSNESIVLAMDKQEQTLWLSIDYGETWDLVQRNVKSFFWGVENVDEKITLFVERMEASGTSTLLKYGKYFQRGDAITLINGIEDVQVIGKYIFATKRQHHSGSTDDSLQLLVSYNRKDFKNAVFPSNLTHIDYFIADVSEGHVFVCGTYPDMGSNLYIADEDGVNYSLSLEKIFFYSPKRYTGDVWLSEKRTNAFVELHKVDGLRGIYIASQMRRLNEDDQLGLEDLQTLITYDKGHIWQIVTPPEFDYEGRYINCSEQNNCSLHLAQEFSMLYTESIMAQPILSKKSAIGSILSTGNLGASLNGRPNFYVSPDAGVSWRQALSGQYLYNFGDHGGIIVAVKHFKAQGQTNEILYSTDLGETWNTYKFLDREIYVFGLFTEPEEKATVFTLFGSDVDKMQLIVGRIDLRNAFKYKCNESDYEMWSPSLGSTETRNCLLGRRDVYNRRMTNSDCYNGQDFDGYVSSETCECTRDDYECDNGFELDSLNSNTTLCIPENYDAQAGTPTSCIAGQFYNRTRGYRKIPGNGCQGGFESRYESELISCPVKDEQEYLLFAQRRKISRLSLGEESRPHDLQILNLKEVIAVENDYSSGSIFWADVELRKIMRLHLDGMHAMDIILEGDIKYIEGMAFDWISRNLYFVDGEKHTIEVIRMDVNNIDRMRRTIWNSTMLEKPRGIAVHPVEGYMFWTDWGNTKACVGRSYLDGSNQKLLFTKPLVRWPNSVTVDYQIQRIYWVDAGLDYIASADLDGGHMKYIIRGDLVVPSPFAIAVYKDKIYWSDWRKRVIYSADKYNGTGVRSVVSPINDPMGLKIVSHTLQQGTNQCAANTSKCTHLCMGRPNKGMSCLCPDGFRAEKSSSGNERCLCDDDFVMMANGTCRPQEESCASGFFQCGNGSCVSAIQKCDGLNDCGDESDEVNCTYTKCKENQFACNNGNCISLKWKCDSDDDCLDGSDEVGCTNINSTVVCKPGEFPCIYTNTCLPSTWICDKHPDCPDGSDEKNCNTSSCPRDSFSCLDGDCIYKSWHCDGDNDCRDNSDEENCTTISPINPTFSSLATTLEPVNCSVGHSQCSNGRCIPNRWRCDGEKDCSDGSDELDCGSTQASTTSPVDSTTNYLTTLKPGNCTAGYLIPCNNGKCIPSWWKCDGANDCGDGSDELNCGTTQAPNISTEQTTLSTTTFAVTTLEPVNCSVGHSQCSNGRCIPNSWRCDGEKDCSDGFDEMDCGSTQITPTTYLEVDSATNYVTTVKPVNCSVGYSKCSNGRCIPNSWRCDDEKDCSDGSDEWDCGSTQAPTTSTETTQTTPGCAGNYFKCRNGHCIHESRVCDSVADCYGQEDEANCAVRNLFVDKRTVTSTGFNFSWETLKNQSFKYLPSISEEKTNIWRNEYWTHESSHNFTDLKPLTTYNVTVFVKLDSHVFSGNAYISVTTPGGVPSPPENVTASQINSEMVSVLWKPPTNHTASVTGYRIYILPPLPPRREDVMDLKQTHHEIKGHFRPGNSYIFWMTALSENNESVASAPSFLVFYENVFSEAIRGLKITKVTDSSVFITWYPLTTAPDGYIISVSSLWGYVRSPLLIAGPNQNTYHITGLSPGANYIITVLGYKGIRKGPPMIIIGRTTGGPLQAPTNITAALINGTTAELAWMPPVDPRDVKWVYGVFYATSLVSLVDFAPKANTSYTKLIIGALEACKRYSFNVRLIGPLGYGPWGQTVVIESKYDFRAPPKDVAVSRSPDNEQQIVISWNASCDRLDEPIGYKVYVNETKLNKVSWFALAPTTDLKQEIYLKTFYGGHYEIIVQTDYIGSRPATKVYYTAPPIPAPHHLRIFDYVTDHYILTWEEPILPAALKNAKLQYVVRIAENSNNVMSGKESWMKNSPFVFKPKKGKPFHVAVALRDERGLESSLSEAIAVDGTFGRWTYLTGHNLNQTCNIK